MARRRRNGLRDYGWTVAIAVVFALLIRFLLVEAYRIPTGAMRPTLEAGDTIFVAKFPFGMRLPYLDPPLTSGRPPRRGEVVLFSLPNEPGREFIKRVVALPGDEVEVRKGRVLLNRKPLAAEKSTDSCSTEKLPEGPSYGVCFEPPLLEDYGPEKVPAGSVFVIGDLRSPGPNDSASARAPASRSWGLVPISSLRGSALWIWLSIEPRKLEAGASIPKFRFERMFRRIQ